MGLGAGTGKGRMPSLSRSFIKTAIVWLVVALLVGLGTAVPAASPWPRLAAVMRPTALHMLTVGWITQIIFGVALWMFPRYSREQPHGNPILGWTVFAMLNLGLLLRVVAEPVVVLAPSRAAGLALALSGLLQWAAGIGFAALAWPRVRRR